MDDTHEGLKQFKHPDTGTKSCVLAFKLDALRRIFMRTINGPRYTHVFYTVVNTTPLLKDLYQHITPQYAADWEVIGTLLGLPSGDLKAIERG